MDSKVDNAARVHITQRCMNNKTNKQHRQSDVMPMPREVYQPQYRKEEQCYVDQVRRSNLRFDEEEELVSALKEQLRLDKEVEDVKTRLASQHDFNLMDAFQMLDKYSKGWITAPELTEALNEFGSFPHKDDVYLFIRRYDHDQDGRLLYTDFCDAFRPQDEIVASNMERRPAYHIQRGYCRSHFFSRETRDLFLASFRTHFSCEESAELLRQRLGRRPQFNVHDAFQAIDKDGNGYLTR